MYDDNFINKIKSILDKANNKDILNLYNSMSYYQKNIFDSWIKNPDSFIDYSFNQLTFDFDSFFVQKILDMELDFYLENSNLDGNKKNGFTKNITIKTSNNTLIFNRPRLRNEKDFNSIFIPKRTRFIKDLQENIILLFSKNNSINNIKDILAGMFGIKISNGKISALLQEVSSSVFDWRNKQLNKCYFTINIDCTYIHIRDNKDVMSHKIPIYIAVGTKLNGSKEIVGIYLGNETENKNIIDNLYNVDVAESTSFWINVFDDLKDRGVEKVLYMVSDGLAGIECAVKQAFDGVHYQRCVVHLVRNLKKYTTKSNCKSTLADFKNFYSSPNKELALENYNHFLENHKKSKNIIKHFKEYAEFIFPLFDIPVNIRNYIYTNNISESVNSKIKRGFYGRSALPNAEASLNIIFVNLIDLEQKWKNKKVNNWDNIFNELLIVHSDVISKYL